LSDKVGCISISPTTESNWVIGFLNFLYYFLLLLKGERRHISIIKDRILRSKQKLSILYMLFWRKKINSDFLISHFGDSAHFLLKLRNLKIYSGKIGVVFHAHEITKYAYLKKYKEVYEQCFLECDKIYPISNLWKERIIKMGCDPEKIYVIRMGIDINEYPYRLKRIETEQKVKFIQVGRLTEKKGILDTLTAFGYVKEKINFSLDIIGDGDLLGEAKSLVEELNLQDSIVFHGAKSNDFVRKMLQESDIYLLPSKTASNGDMEGIPVALMEAMAVGLPVISTYHSGIPELITNFESGLLVEENNPEQLANAIVEIYEMRESEIELIRANARRKIATDFNIEIEADKLVKIINQSISLE
ncbi:MAG: glycosyltransferase, partial [Marinomonas sp.]